MITKHQALLISGITFLTGVVGFTTVYLPFYSPTVLERQRQLMESNNSHDLVSSKRKVHDGSRGSMWLNMDREIKNAKVNSSNRSDSKNS